ncbi:MAG: integrin alpha [Phycisphaerales bacterium]
MRTTGTTAISSIVAVCGLAITASELLAQGPLGEPFPPILELADLDGQIGFRIDSVLASDRLGWSVGALGDINGDGVDDVIVGAPFANPDGMNPAGGAAFVFFGSATGFPAIVDAALLDGTNGFVAQGSREPGPTGRGERAGTAVAGAGDLNGDGVADAIIGAPRAGERYVRTNAGASYVVFGRGDGAFDPAVRLADLDGDTGFVVPGLDKGDNNGDAVSSAGDINGDGFDDVLIGVRGGGEGTYGGGGYYPYYYCCPGEAYVIYGRDVAGGASFPAELVFDPDAQDDGFAVFGEDVRGNLGGAVASAGDVNGDGFEDVLVSAPEYRTYYGATHVIFGQPTGSASSFNVRDIDGTNGFTIRTVPFVGFTFSADDVDTAGDLNGDGVDDVIVNSRYDGAFVVFGRTDGFPADVILEDLDGTDGFRLTGTRTSDVAGIGDFNGDGVDDIAVGDWLATTGAGMRAGAVYVVFGSRDGFAAELDLLMLDGENGFRIDGSVENDGVGSVVSAAGDVNDDGNADLLIGTRDQITGDNDIGAYVVFGRRSCPADLDGDGELTIFDFLEFQNLFATGDPRADFDGDGDLTLFDFLAFQNAFDAGCG